MPSSPVECQEVDCLVVGGGPAGSAAAISAAAAGLSVALADKATFPRDKCCGDGLTSGALRELERLGLDPSTIPSWKPVRRVQVHPPGHRVVHLELPPGPGLYAAVARRCELDHALLERARAGGVAVFEGHAAIDLELTASGVATTVRSRDRELTVRSGYVIAADGMWSPIRKLLGVDDPTYRGEWHAFRQYVHHVGPEASEQLIVWFEPDLLPGYVWSFPLPDGSANIGFGIRRGGKWAVRDMARLWPELLERPRIASVLGAAAVAEAPHKAWPIPARVDKTLLTADRVLFVGDAAAVTDGFTGEGIGQALATGRWAAEAVVAGGPRRADRVRDAYETTVRQGLVADHRMSELLSRALSHRKGVRISSALAGATPWTRRNFARWLFEDYPRAMVVTPRRWHSGMFTGPGSFADQT